jgi:probable phosphoglycerate mutase
MRTAGGWLRIRASPIWSLTTVRVRGRGVPPNICRLIPLFIYRTAHMEATRICLVRHGETSWNAEKRIQGQIDIGLNAAGQVQAEAAASWLAEQPVTALYSSDLLRARQTAERIAARLDLLPRFRAEFRERRYGFFEGLTYEESRARYPADYESFETRDPEFVIPFGGESLRQLHERVSAGLHDVAAAHRGQTIVVVTHGGVLDIVNRLVRGRSLSSPRDFLIPNAGINWVSGCDDGWQLEAWGGTAHLARFGLDELP